jgi:predicted GIY-YIG superfamily endonuclease
MKGYMYILECADGSYYTGSTKNLELRLQQHMAGEGANHTKKRLPVALVYFEEFNRIDEAFYREKQVQGWSRKKKEVLIESFISIKHNEQHFNEVVEPSRTEVVERSRTEVVERSRTEVVERSRTEVVERSRNHLLHEKLNQLSECKNETHWTNYYKKRQ